MVKKLRHVTKEDRCLNVQKTKGSHLHYSSWNVELNHKKIVLHKDWLDKKWIRWEFFKYFWGYGETGTFMHSWLKYKLEKLLGFVSIF